MTPPTSLALNAERIARLTRPQRETRVLNLVEESHEIVNTAIARHVRADGRALAAVVVLFSGGNDSTVLAHMFRSVATHAAHANTTIGIEQTREFVRSTCAEWELPLLERCPPRAADHFGALVLDQGFPGPGHHFKMYQRLKERGLEQIRRELISDPRRERLIFLAGRRRSESQRRARIPISERRGSVVWASPLVHWTKLDLNMYRLMAGDVPVNDVSNLLHMSGECCCGAFAKPGEREELGYWFPDLIEEIEALETAIAHRGDIPQHRRTWGWGASARKGVRAAPRQTGRLCTSCDARVATPLLPDTPITHSD